MSAYPLSQLGDVAEVVAGDPAPQDPQAFAPDGPLFVRMQDVGRHHRHPTLSDSTDRLNAEWAAGSRLRLFPRDSVLIPKSGASVNLNHRAKLATDAYVVSHLAIVIPDRTRIEPDYLYWWSTDYDPRTQAQVTSLPSLKLSTLKAATIPLPPLEEQRWIIGILNRAAKIEWLRVRAQDRLWEFIPALFFKMFGDPSENPKGWETQPFIRLVEDATRSVTKIKKQSYSQSGETPIVDQGKSLVAGFTNVRIGRYEKQFPVIVFGDHTRRFKLIRFPFFLGADGAKLLRSIRSDLDPVFLFGQLRCLKIDNAGYSRHFKFLKSRYLIVPPIQQQMRFRALLEGIESAITNAEIAMDDAKAVTKVLMSRLLSDSP